MPQMKVCEGGGDGDQVAHPDGYRRLIHLRSCAPGGGAARIKTWNSALYELVTDTFGAHVKRLREVRRLTQEELAERSGLAADTIRRLEHQEFSPSLRTLRKVCKGLELSVAAMFNSFELGAESEELSRIQAMLLGRTQAELVLVERVLSELFAALEQYRKPSGTRDGSEPDC
jgi:transcriptional regulator with XRE-family HTH domain